jgi:hypothetical protein
MSHLDLRSSDDAKRWAWLGLLTVASVVLSLPFACAAPFAALVSLGGLNMDRRDAFLLAAAVVLANQAVGFGILGYGFETSTILWGVAMGIDCLLTAWAALEAAHLADGKPWVVRTLFTFAAASVAWEASMVVARLFLSENGHDLIDPDVSLTVLKINAGSFLALLALQFVGERIGIAPHRKPVPHA